MRGAGGRRSDAITLGLGRPAGQQQGGLADRQAVLQDGHHDLGDRHLDAVRPGQLEDRLGDLTPSPVCVVTAITLAPTAIPAPRCSPKVRLRDSGEEHVAIRSPIPARPRNVIGLAPSATPSRDISARPRVMRMACELAP